MARGNIRGRWGVTLTPDDFYQIGLVAQDTEDYGLSAQWLEYALEDREFTGHVPDVLLDLAESYSLMNDHEEAADLAKVSNKMQENPNNVTNQERIEHYKDKYDNILTGDDDTETISVLPTEWKQELPDWYDRYLFYCNDDNEIELFRSPDVFCNIRNKDNYYSWAKQEVLSQNPFVTIIHDVITDGEREKFRNLGNFYILVF